jgi:hypothetical protein
MIYSKIINLLADGSSRAENGLYIHQLEFEFAKMTKPDKVTFGEVRTE